MKILISPVSFHEVAAVVRAGADIVDLKNVAEGSLGAAPPWKISAVVESLKGSGIPVSASLGDLPSKPGTAALAAFGAACCGVDYVKAGLYGAETLAEARQVMVAVARAARSARERVRVVAAGYADHGRFGGIPPDLVLRAAAGSGSDAVMLDTAFKDGKSLFDVLPESEILSFVRGARRLGLEVALAGSLRAEHLGRLRDLSPDFIGVRGAVCDGADRGKTISLERARAFLEEARAEKPGRRFARGCTPYRIRP